MAYDLTKSQIYCSEIGSIMGSSHKAITPNQLAEIERLETKLLTKPLTTKQEEDYARLIQKRDFVPDLDISDGCKSTLIDMYCYLFKNKRKSSYIGMNARAMKGSEVEMAAIEMLSEFTGVNYCVDKITIGNDYLTGKLDAFIGECADFATQVVDVKCSWDIASFYKTIEEGLEPNIEWQMQGYMGITGAQTAEVAYCLLNTPETIMNDEISKLKRKMHLNWEDQAFLEEKEKLKSYHNYDEMPISEKICIFTVDRDDEKIESIYKKVVECRKWLVNFHETVINSVGAKKIIQIQYNSPDFSS